MTTTSAKLLIVDDEPVIRNFLVRALKREGYDVQAASDGREALALLQQHAYDLLLTDIKMDHLDGVGLLAEAKALYPDMAVILLTGHATVQSAITALRQGAHDYLLKPVKNEDIIAAVAAGLDTRKHEQRRDKLEQIATQMLGVLNNGDLPPAASQPDPDAPVIVGSLTIDPAAYSARLHDAPVDLTPTEFRLLLKLARTPGAAFEYVALVEDACGYTCSRQEAREIIGTHVLNLRKKLDIAPDEALYVQSVRGVGYRLVPFAG